MLPITAVETLQSDIDQLRDSGQQILLELQSEQPDFVVVSTRHTDDGPRLQYDSRRRNRPRLSGRLALIGVVLADYPNSTVAHAIVDGGDVAPGRQFGLMASPAMLTRLSQALGQNPELQFV